MTQPVVLLIVMEMGYVLVTKMCFLVFVNLILINRIIAPHVKLVMLDLDVLSVMRDLSWCKTNAFGRTARR